MLERKLLPCRDSRLLVAAALAASTWILSAPSARADLAIGVDIETVVPLEFDQIETGPAFGVRLGAQLHLPLITLTPEVGFHYASFTDGPEVYRGLIGGRLGIGELLRFGAFAHLGFGHQTWEIATVDVSHTGVSIDAGLFLDLTILPLIDVGVHLGYARLAANEDDGIDANQWLAFGLHAALIL